MAQVEDRMILEHFAILLCYIQRLNHKLAG
jgi:hypothetical protein